MPYNVTINKFIRINQGSDLDAKVDSTEEIKELFKNVDFKNVDFKNIKSKDKSQDKSKDNANGNANDNANNNVNDNANNNANDKNKVTTTEITFLKNVSNYLSHIQLQFAVILLMSIYTIVIIVLDLNYVHIMENPFTQNDGHILKAIKFLCIFITAK